MVFNVEEFARLSAKATHKRWVNCGKQGQLPGGATIETEWYWRCGHLVVAITTSDPHQCDDAAFIVYARNHADGIVARLRAADVMAERGKEFSDACHVSTPDAFCIDAIHVSFDEALVAYDAARKESDR